MVLTTGTEVAYFLCERQATRIHVFAPRLALACETRPTTGHRAPRSEDRRSRAVCSARVGSSGAAACAVRLRGQALQGVDVLVDTRHKRTTATAQHVRLSRCTQQHLYGASIAAHTQASVLTSCIHERRPPSAPASPKRPVLAANGCCFSVFFCLCLYRPGEFEAPPIKLGEHMVQYHQCWPETRNLSMEGFEGGFERKSGAFQL